MSVKLAKNGTWLAQFRCKDKFGNEVHKCKRGFATAEEAQAWEDEFIASAGCTMEMTFGDFFKVYEADLRPRLREHTWRQKEYAIKSRVLPFFANKKMDEIRTIDIVRWQNALMAPDANGGKPYSATYLRTLNNQLTAILNHAERYYGLRQYCAPSNNSTVFTMLYIASSPLPVFAHSTVMSPWLSPRHSCIPSITGWGLPKGIASSSDEGPTYSVERQIAALSFAHII